MWPRPKVACAPAAAAAAPSPAPSPPGLASAKRRSVEMGNVAPGGGPAAASSSDPLAERMRQLEDKMVAMQQATEQLLEQRVSDMTTRFEGSMTSMMNLMNESQQRNSAIFTSQLQTLMDRLAPAPLAPAAAGQ